MSSSEIRMRGGLNGGRVTNNVAWLRSSDGILSSHVRVGTTRTASGTETIKTGVGINRAAYQISNATNGVVERNSPGVNVRTSSAAVTPAGNSGGRNARENCNNNGG